MTQLGAPVRLASRQKARAVAALAAAFVDDPGYVYVLPGPPERARAITRFMDALLSFALLYGEVYTTAEVRGVACWLPVRGPSLSLWQLVRTGFALPRAVLSLRGESRVRMSDILRYNDEIHANAVKELHWYLGALGVLPEWQRRGIGTRLLQPLLARADAEGVPCYLETQTADNVRLYERQRFEVIHEGEVPGHGLRMWAMLRQPDPGAVFTQTWG
jgi:GNAT superfamily N-acetyltransferase